jgi:hypothetical protein
MRLATTLRVLFGLLLILHGLSQAVLPLRGAGAPVFPDTDWMPVVLYAIATIGFVIAGLGVLGVRPMDRAISETMVLASIYSLVGLWRLGHADLWAGAVLDLVLVAVGLWRGFAGWFPRTPYQTRRQMAGTAAGLLVLGYVVISTIMWAHHRAWGTSVEEQRMALPGDPPDRDPRFDIQHAVTVNATPAEVWPWLLQLGQDRGGFYSYWLERLFGADVHNVAEIRPEWQRRQVGDFVRATQPTYLGGILGERLGWTVIALEPQRALVLENWGAFVLVPASGGRTRLIVRSSLPTHNVPAWQAALQFTAFELPHFIMERRMLLNIKALAEEHHGARAERDLPHTPQSTRRRSD